MRIRENIKSILDTCFSETKEENKQIAESQLCELFNENNKFKTKWITPEEGREDTYNKLYLAWQPGYPLMIADWLVGRGYRDVNTDISIHPLLVAYIEMPTMTTLAYTKKGCF